MAQTLSLIIALTSGGFRCSGDVSSKYPKPLSFIVDVIFVNHGEMVDPVSHLVFRIWKRIEEILLNFPVISLAQKLTILCLMVQFSLDRPSSPRATLPGVLGFR